MAYVVRPTSPSGQLTAGISVISSLNTKPTPRLSNVNDCDPQQKS